MKINYTEFEKISFVIKAILKIPKEGSTKNKTIIRNNQSKQGNND